MSVAPIGPNRAGDGALGTAGHGAHGGAGDTGGQEVARRVARLALEGVGTSVGTTVGTTVGTRVGTTVGTRVGTAPPPASAALRNALVLALANEGLGDRRSRVRVASDVTLLARLLGDGGAGPLDGLARHVGFVLAQPTGVPLWEDLRRLSTLLDDLGVMVRAQRRRARLVPGAAERARGTELVMARAMDAFAATWRTGPRTGPRT